MPGHLVISRRVSERIMIGPDIEIMVSDIVGGKVDIAIKAPKRIRIHRKESYMEEEKKATCPHEVVINDRCDNCGFTKRSIHVN